MTTEQEQEVCANCGDLVPCLDDFTGWCYPCSGKVPPASLNSAGGTTDNWYTRWLANNADEIERTMVTHRCSAAQAKKLVAIANRPICQCCHKPISRGNPRSVFCTKTKECQRAQAVFDMNHHLPREDAIAKSLEAVIMMKLLSKYDAA